MRPRGGMAPRPMVPTAVFCWPLLRVCTMGVNMVCTVIPAVIPPSAAYIGFLQVLLRTPFNYLCMLWALQSGSARANYYSCCSLWHCMNDWCHTNVLECYTGNFMLCEIPAERIWDIFHTNKPVETRDRHVEMPTRFWQKIDHDRQCIWPKVKIG